MGAFRFGWLAIAASMAMASCGSATASDDTASFASGEQSANASDARSEPISPLPEPSALDPRRLTLGRDLFRDPLLSRDGKLTCTSCHAFSKGGADGRVRSTIEGREPLVNTPTIFNVAYNYRFNWNAKFDSLEEQIDAPMLGKRAMDVRWPELLRRLEASAYASRFRGIYADGVTAANVRDALVVYERSLVTPNARFDRYLRGDDDAISSDEKEGYAIFKSYGCVSCHQGVNVGGNLVQKLGAVTPYFPPDAPGTEGDQGLMAVTHKETDLHVFRVASLRNVELTAPYFHNGSAETLEKAIGVMAKHQLGRTLTEDQTYLVAAFLKTLTGETPAEIE